MNPYQVQRFPGQDPNGGGKVWYLRLVNAKQPAAQPILTSSHYSTRWNAGRMGKKMAKVFACQFVDVPGRW